MKNEITYTEHNGLCYPDLALPKQTNYPLGKYANLRLDFMKKHRRGTYTTLLTEGRLNEYLHEIDLQARSMLKEILKKFDDCHSELIDINDRDIFKYAFKLGAQIMLAIVSEKEI